MIRKLKAAGFIEVRSGKGSHRLLKHPTTGKEVWVAVHTRKTFNLTQPPVQLVPTGENAAQFPHPRWVVDPDRASSRRRQQIRTIARGATVASAG